MEIIRVRIIFRCLENMNKELEAIQKRRGFYLGNSTRPFTSLVAFFTGYQCGFAAVKHNHATPEEFVPHDFHKFVTEKYGEKFPAGGKGWQSFIEENTSSEEEAFNLFFTLRDEYDQKLQGK
jgi:hypothetical protein